MKATLPNSSIQFSYNPFEYFLTFRKSRGCVDAILKYKGTYFKEVSIRQLHSYGSHPSINIFFSKDKEGIEKEFGAFNLLKNEADQDSEHLIIEGTRYDGVRLIKRSNESVIWMIVGKGETSTALALNSDIQNIANSINIISGKRSSSNLPLTALGSINKTFEKKPTSLVVDLLLGPVLADLHITSLHIFPNIDKSKKKILQGRQLAIFSRVVNNRFNNWHSLAVPKGGFLVTHLPMFFFGNTTITKDGKISFYGYDDEGNLLGTHTNFTSLEPEIKISRPVPSNWIVINTPEEVSIHRLAIQIKNGALFCSQRGAMDLLLPKEVVVHSLQQYNTLEQELESYPSFGQDILAPCSGEVIHVVNDLSDLPVGIRDAKNPRGNQICIKRQDGFVVVLAHLKSKSVTVRINEKIREGQIVGKVGNSGNSSEPHLHIHIARSSLRISDGIIFSFKN